MEGSLVRTQIYGVSDGGMDGGRRVFYGRGVMNYGGFSYFQAPSKRRRTINSPTW